jgi:hypothetical protein
LWPEVFRWRKSRNIGRDYCWKNALFWFRHAINFLCGQKILKIAIRKKKDLNYEQRKQVIENRFLNFVVRRRNHHHFPRVILPFHKSISYIVHTAIQIGRNRRGGKACLAIQKWCRELKN